MQEKEPYLKYIGQAFIVGVPARDLTLSETQRYGEKRLLDSGLYVLAGLEETQSKQEHHRQENKMARGGYENKKE